MNNQQYLSLEYLEQLPGKVNYESPPGEFEEDAEETLDRLDLQGGQPASQMQGSFPKPVASNQAYFVSVLPLSPLLPSLHQNLLQAILAKTAQQNKAYQMPSERSETVFFCVFFFLLHARTVKASQHCAGINILGSGKQYGSANFYQSFASC